MANSTRLYEEVQNNSEALVMAHLGMVKRVALHLKVRLPPFMELDELIQVGMIGLLEAARAYNPAKAWSLKILPTVAFAVPFWTRSGACPSCPDLR